MTETDRPPVGSADFDDGFAVVRVSRDDGGHAEQRVDIARGDGRNPMTDDELRAKFADCCALGGVDPRAATELHDTCRAFAGTTLVRRLTRAIADTGREQNNA